MTHQDPYNPRPQGPPAIDPLPPGANPPRYRNAAETRNWNSGVIAAAILAALIVIGIAVWAGTSGQQTAINPPAQTTGQNTNPPPAPK